MTDDERDGASSRTAQRINDEAMNHQTFFTDRHFHDSGERVGDDPHWILTVVEEDTPLDRDEPYRWYYVFDDLDNVSADDIKLDSVEKINLDRAEPDDISEKRHAIVETNTLETIDELRDLLDQKT